MDKKTFALMAGLGLIILFVFFYSSSAKVNINQFVNFGEYMETPQGSESGKTTFKELLVTPSPTLSPFPTMPPP